MYALLFCLCSSIVLAFVSVLRMVCITNVCHVWGHTEIFPVCELREIQVKLLYASVNSTCAHPPG